MKATGIVRRIDDLGRVVIPKEIRRTMRIREGDPLEIFTDRDGEVIFKKYSPMGELSEFANEYADVLTRTSGYAVCVTDKDSVIAVAGAPKKELLEKRVSKEIEEVMDSRSVFIHNGTQKYEIIDGDGKYTVGVAAPIITEGDTIGSVVMLTESDTVSMGDVEQKLAVAAAGFLGKHMES